MLPPDLPLPIDSAVAVVDERDGFPLPSPEKRVVLEMGRDLDKFGLHASLPAVCMVWICRRDVADDGFVVDEGDACCDCRDNEDDVDRRWDSSDLRELIVAVDLLGLDRWIGHLPKSRRAIAMAAVPDEGDGAPF
ncbi:hypothetical protein ACLOJK_024310 [Asimina triloba]